MSKQLELVLQDQKQVQNPCAFCEDQAEEMGLVIQEAEFDYETIVLGIRICMPLCHEHYFDIKESEEGN